MTPGGRLTPDPCMSFFSAIRVALGSLLVNKGRSILTSLGIVIGISAVIALVSAGDGARLLLDEKLDSIGKNIILVTHDPQVATWAARVVTVADGRIQSDISHNPPPALAARPALTPLPNGTNKPVPSAT